MANIPENRIPELLRQRLQVSAEAASDAEHPDPNLLAAHAEQSLRGAERAGVVEHLSHCKQCREVVALALPQVSAELPFPGRVEAMALPRRDGAKRRHWFTDESLLWARLAATVTVAIGIGITYYAVHDRNAELGPAPAIRASSAGANSQSGSFKPPPAGEKIRADIAGEANKSAPTDTLEKPPHSSREASLAKVPAGPPATPARHEDKESQADAVSKKQITAPPSASQGAGGRLSAAETASAGAPSSLPVPVHTDKDKLKVSPAARVAAADERASASPADTLTQETFPPAAAEAAAKSAGSGGANAGAVSGGIAPQMAGARRQTGVAEQPPPADSQAVLQAQAATESQDAAAPQTEQSQTLQAAGSQPKARNVARPGILDKSSAASHSSARWTISATGHLQRLVAGTSGTLAMSSQPETARGDARWTDVAVGRNVVFRAVAAIGPNVWAGGSGHQIFYSHDDGIHWKRVPGQWQGDVTSIRLRDVLHGELQTTAGERWMTRDGGEHWSEAGRAP